MFCGGSRKIMKELETVLTKYCNAKVKEAEEIQTAFP